MSTNEPSMSGRPVRKHKQMRDVRHALWMKDDSGSDIDLVEFDVSADQRFMQDQNFACRWTCAKPSRNLASTCGEGKCRVDTDEIHTYLYNMTIR